MPERVVTRARDAMHACRADTLLALGGGSAIGLAKALCLEDDAKLVAIPTTYSGSERTAIYGITRGGEKVTGRDARVRPDVVIYDPHLTLDVSAALTTQSLLNALAHPIAAMSTSSDPALRQRATGAIARLVTCAAELVRSPRSIAARRAALEATALAGSIIDVAELGEHHRLAHFLGGRFGLPHAAVHSVLLPQTLSNLRASGARGLRRHRRSRRRRQSAGASLRPPPRGGCADLARCPRSLGGRPRGRDVRARGALHRDPVSRARGRPARRLIRAAGCRASSVGSPGASPATCRAPRRRARASCAGE